MWDLSILQLIPGMRVAAPRDAESLREEVREALAVDDGPTAVRFPTGAVGDRVVALERRGGVDVLARGPAKDVLLVAVGAMGRLAVEVAERAAAQGIGVTVVDPRWVAPVPDELLAMAREHALVVTVEDSGRRGGVGSVLSQALRDADIDVPARDIGIPQRFLAHGTRAEVQAEVGLTAQEVARRIVEHVARTQPAMESAADRTEDRRSQR
jgi:1-deoxy-D-xylulose-5-phosphate synthase